MNFETERLLCQPLSLQDYSDFEEGRSPNWSRFSNPYKHLIEGPTPLPYRIPRVKLNPEFAEIAIVLAIEKATKVIVGSAGFHDFPNEDGMIEIGFGIVPEKQNQGFGTSLSLLSFIAVKPKCADDTFSGSPLNSTWHTFPISNSPPGQNNGLAAPLLLCNAASASM